MIDIIQFGRPIDPEIPKENLPSVDLFTQDIPSLGDDPFQVYFVKQAHAAIMEHISSVPEVESGGLLIGHPFKTFTGDITFVIVSAALPQDSHHYGRTYFTIGPNESAKARRQLAEEYPGQIVVGWYHSHPGFGVFLSEYDKTITRSIYNLPWHLALVIDPIQNNEGIFVGKEGVPIASIDRLGRSWISLEKVPDSVKAIALYNQYRKGRDVLSQLAGLISSSDQLEHWDNHYRDLPMP